MQEHSDAATLWLLLIAVWLALAVRRRMRKRRLDSHGTGRFATRQELATAGMLNTSSGLILGRLIEAKRWNLNGSPVVRLPQAVHTLVCSPTGGGKGVSMIIPWLLTNPENAVVIDFKGENALLTAEHRARKFGHRIVLLDPFDAVASRLRRRSDTINPLDPIDKHSPHAVDACRELSKLLELREEKNGRQCRTFCRSGDIAKQGGHCRSCVFLRTAGAVAAPGPGNPG